MARRHVTSRDPMSIQQKGKQTLSMCRAIGRPSRTSTGRVLCQQAMFGVGRPCRLCGGGVGGGQTLLGVDRRVGC